MKTYIYTEDKTLSLRFFVLNTNSDGSNVFLATGENANVVLKLGDYAVIFKEDDKFVHFIAPFCYEALTMEKDEFYHFTHDGSRFLESHPSYPQERIDNFNSVNNLK
jgi:hypothetical protein